MRTVACRRPGQLFDWFILEFHAMQCDISANIYFGITETDCNLVCTYMLNGHCRVVQMMVMLTFLSGLS